MTTPATPSAPKPAGDDRNLVALDETTFEGKLHAFWQNNGTAILTLIVLVLAGILAKGGWDYLATQKELGVEKDYAAASTPEQLKAFAAAHTGHALAGIALLRAADDAYATGKLADALAGYEAALPALKDSPLAARARLGRAITKAVTGKAADGAAELKQLADDATLDKSVRTEATYQLASLAAERGDAAEVQKLSDQLMRLDAASPWTQRALGLRAQLPAPKPAEPTKAGDQRPEEKKSDANSSMQIKLPGK